MTIKVGDSIPAVTLTTMGAGGATAVTTDELFAGKRVAVFAVPGAFTPTCSAKHLPGFIKRADAIKAKGVDEIACVSVNDPYTMRAWEKTLDAAGVTFYGDSDASFTESVNEALDLNVAMLGPGKRSNRYSALVEDGVVTQAFVEEGAGDLKVSDGATMFAAL